MYVGKCIVSYQCGFNFISDRLVKSLQDTEINNLYFDLIKFLLMAIFNLQEEEEEEEQELEQNQDTLKGTFKKKAVQITCPFSGVIDTLFCVSADVCPGFQSRCSLT